MRKLSALMLITTCLALTGCGDALWHRGDVDSAWAAASERNTLVMMDFYTNW